MKACEYQLFTGFFVLKHQARTALILVRNGKSAPLRVGHAIAAKSAQAVPFRTEATEKTRHQ
tara:strand:- start:9471 stop:9656 length:186 start_codon:yes stop_codon:yes gene_type:complete